ncbi:MAG: cupin domain-containing protein [Methanomicrobiaceae archaeon]|nr:cupin domain-containing protein [Methanomicrobiaceae archaeon]
MMNLLRYAIIIFLICIAAVSGCINTETDKKITIKEDKAVIVSDSGFFISDEEKRLKIEVFSSTIVENIISPDILKSLGHYPQISYEMSKILIPAGKGNPPHILKDTTETMYILSGEADAFVNDKLYNLNAGDTLFIPKDLIQEIRNTGDTELVYLSLTYPPYKEDNEIIPDNTSYEKDISENALLISKNETGKMVFFSDVWIYNILNPDILSAHITDCSFNQGLALAKIPKGSMTAPHILEGTTEVMYFISGEGILNVNERAMIVKEGRTAYIPPGAYQSLYNTGEDFLIYLTITDPAYSESIDSSVAV